MINDLEKKKLKKYLKRGYAKRVVKAIEEKTGITYTPNYVRRVLNHGVNSPEIEVALLEVTDQYIEDEAIFQKNKSQIIEKISNS